jgi:hypothetical protein
MTTGLNVVNMIQDSNNESEVESLGGYLLWYLDAPYSPFDNLGLIPDSMRSNAPVSAPVSVPVSPLLFPSPISSLLLASPVSAPPNYFELIAEEMERAIFPTSLLSSISYISSKSSISTLPTEMGNCSIVNCNDLHCLMNRLIIVYGQEEVTNMLNRLSIGPDESLGSQDLTHSDFTSSSDISTIFTDYSSFSASVNLHKEENYQELLTSLELNHGEVSVHPPSGSPYLLSIDLNTSPLEDELAEYLFEEEDFNEVIVYMREEEI